MKTHSGRRQDWRPLPSPLIRVLNFMLLILYLKPTFLPLAPEAQSARTAVVFPDMETVPHDLVPTLI